MSIRILFTVLLINCLIFSVICEKLRYNGFTVLRITPQTSQQLDYLKQLSENNLELDFWTYPSSLNRTVDIMIPPHLKESFGNVFRQKSFTFQTMISDVENLLEEQRKEAREAVPGYWNQYQKLPQVEAFLRAIVAQNSPIASLQSIGKTFQNRDILCLKISTGDESNKKIIFIDANIHAREWITSATCTYIIQQIVDGVKNGDQDINSLLRSFVFYFIPVANPDGYVFSHDSNRMWRKTRSTNTGSTCIGADPNRNFNHNWTVTGSSTNPCSDTYHGSRPFSEPITKCISDFISSLHKPNLLFYMAMHSYSQLLLSPWGYTTALPPNNADLVRFSTVFTTEIKKAYGTVYKSGTSTNVLYAASGNGCDWAYGVAGFPYSFTLEQRDTGSNGFVLPVSAIKPSGVETWAALLASWQSLQ